MNHDHMATMNRAVAAGSIREAAAARMAHAVTVTDLREVVVQVLCADERFFEANATYLQGLWNDVVAAPDEFTDFLCDGLNAGMASNESGWTSRRNDYCSFLDALEHCNGPAGRG